jgi:small subunit ribosomal protein S20
VANTAQAKKRARQNKARALHNTSQRSTLRTAIKKTLRSIQEGGETASSTYKEMTILLDRYAGKKIIHANKAARLKSRINKKLKAKSKKKEERASANLGLG